jgi:hypothetical protein
VPTVALHVTEQGGGPFTLDVRDEEEDTPLSTWRDVDVAPGATVDHTLLVTMGPNKKKTRRLRVEACNIADRMCALDVVFVSGGVKPKP